MQLPTLEEIDAVRASGYRPEVVGCFLHNKKILFVFNKTHKLWQFPQGGIDNGESVNDAIMREMTEELGSSFVSHVKKKQFVGENQVQFPSHSKNSKELKTDSDTDIYMHGKKYYFIAMQVDTEDLHIQETEFDKSKWVDYLGANRLVRTIYQKGKKRITVNAIEQLHALGLI